MRALLAGMLLPLVACAPAVHPEPETQPPLPDGRLALQPAPILLPPPLPDSTGWGVPVLSVLHAPDGSIYTGTHGHGVYRYRLGDSAWARVALPVPGEAAVTALGAGDDALWFGTAGHGWGRLPIGGGRGREPAVTVLSGGWAWVALNGVAVRGGVVAIGTAAGVRISEDGGARWRCVTGRNVSAAVNAGCDEVVPALASSHVLAVHADGDGHIWIGHLAGLAMSADRGRSWREPEESSLLPRVRIRAIAAVGERVWAATESHIYEGNAATLHFQPARARVIGYEQGEALPGSVRALIRAPRGMWPAIATSNGLAAPSPDGAALYRLYRSGVRGGGDVWGALWWTRPYSPFAATGTGLDSYLAAHPMRQRLRQPTSCAALPEGRAAAARDSAGVGAPDSTAVSADEWAAAVAARREAAARAVAAAAAACRPRLETAVAAGVPRHTLLQRPIRGVDGNPYENPLRPPALNGGALIFHTPAGTPVRAVGDGVIEATTAGVVLRTDVTVRGSPLFVTYEGVAAEREPGERVRSGDIVARVVARTDRPDEPAALHLSTRMLDATGRDTLRVNAALGVRPVDGTGIVALRVLGESGEVVAGARLYGVALAQPTETPFHTAVTYEAGIAAHPSYGENLVVAGVPAGTYLLSLEAGDRRAWRHVRVLAGHVTFAELQLAEAPTPESSDSR